MLQGSTPLWSSRCKVLLNTGILVAMGDWISLPSVSVLVIMSCTISGDMNLPVERSAGLNHLVPEVGIARPSWMHKEDSSVQLGIAV